MCWELAGTGPWKANMYGYVGETKVLVPRWQRRGRKSVTTESQNKCPRPGSSGAQCARKPSYTYNKSSAEPAPAILHKPNVGATVPVQSVFGLHPPTSGRKTMVGIWERKGTSFSSNSTCHISINELRFLKHRSRL